MPELTSVIARCSGVVSRTSTIASTSPAALRTIRPKSTPVVAVRSIVSTVASASLARCSSTSACSVAASISGVSP